MTADENVATMQRAYHAFNTGDIDTLTDLFDETAVWHLPGHSSMADDYQGRDATLAYFGQLAEKTGGTFRAELQHLAADGDHPRGRHPSQQRPTEAASTWMSATASSSNSRTAG